MASFRKSHHIFFLPPVEAAEVIIVTCVFSAAKMEEKLFKDLEKKRKADFTFNVFYQTPYKPK